MFGLEDVKPKPLAGLKKTIVYSSEKEKSFIEGALNILSAVDKKSPSAILEDLIAKTLLPENSNASDICKQLFASEINNFGALEKVFDIYAAGVNNEARYQNGYDLVEYLHGELTFASFPSSKETEGFRQFFCSNFHQMYLKVKSECTAENEDDLLTYESPVKYIKYHLDTASQEPEAFNPINLTDIIKKHWDTLGNFTYTYRALSALCRLLAKTRNDYAEDRVKLVEIISKASEEWN